MCICHGLYLDVPHSLRDFKMAELGLDTRTDIVILGLREETMEAPPRMWVAQINRLTEYIKS